jgi:hypothetical protein
MTKNVLFAHASWGGILDLTVAFAVGLLASVAVAVTLRWLAVHTQVGLLLAQLLPAGEKTAWYLSRASAMVAYLFLNGSLLWGLALSTKVVRDLVPPPLALALHSSLSWFAIGMAGFHAFVLLFDGYYRYTVRDLLIPFSGPYRPQAVGLGIFSFYGLLLTATSFHARKWLGQRNWRRLHYLTFLLYVLVTAHGLLAGSDRLRPGMQAMYMGSALMVLFLTNYRILTLPKLTAAKAAQPIGRQALGDSRPLRPTHKLGRGDQRHS